MVVNSSAKVGADLSLNGQRNSDALHAPSPHYVVKVGLPWCHRKERWVSISGQMSPLAHGLRARCKLAGHSDQKLGKNVHVCLCASSFLCVHSITK